MKIQLKILKTNTVTEQWVGWLNNKDVFKYSEQRFKIHTKHTQKKFLKNKIKDKSCVLFKIYFNKIHIGMAEINNIDNYHKHCEIMYFIGEKLFWNKGIATKVIKNLITYAKKEIGIKKIYAGIYEKNFSSKRVLLKNNFLIEGRIKKFFKYKNTRIDKIIFGKIT